MTVTWDIPFRYPRFFSLLQLDDHIWFGAVVPCEEEMEMDLDQRVSFQPSEQKVLPQRPHNTVLHFAPYQNENLLIEKRDRNAPGTQKGFKVLSCISPNSRIRPISWKPPHSSISGSSSPHPRRPDGCSSPASHPCRLSSRQAPAAATPPG